MSKEYWKEYYRQNRRKILDKCKKWQTNNPEKKKAYEKISREKHIDKYREKARIAYREWILIEENRRHKKEYQRLWWKQKYSFIKEENEELKEIERVLEKGRAIINGYDVEIKQDKGGKLFYLIRQNGLLVYISDKFNNRKELFKDLQYAI